VYNNGRPLRISDLLYYRPYEMKDNFGRDFPGMFSAVCLCGTRSLAAQQAACAKAPTTKSCHFITSKYNASH